MLKVRQAIVVEGRYDKNTLAQVVDAQIIETKGFGVLHDAALLSFLRRVAEAKGLIILTDPDGAGFLIRNYLKGALPRDKVLHAYVPDRYGKEKRKTAPGKEGKLGVEGMEPALLLQALRTCGATLEEGERTTREHWLTKATLYELGLTGRPQSAKKRAALLRRMELPEHLGTNAMLEAIELLYTRDEFYKLVEEHDRDFRNESGEVL